jgi:hypothetical protein
MSTVLNRNATMRLRYHIGDYYPAPDGSNALVDTLNLYVRVEPLSAVHWATMPKHQHSVLAESAQIYASFERMMEFFNDQPLTGSFEGQRTARFTDAAVSVLFSDPSEISYIAAKRADGDPQDDTNLFPIVHTAWPEIAVPEGTAAWATRALMTGRTGAIPDVDVDTAFVGSLGTSFNVSIAEGLRSFVDPTMLGGRWNSLSGRQTVLQRRVSGVDALGEYADGFQRSALEAMTLYASAFDSPLDDEIPRFLPLMGLMSALYNMGLQQKLLWNCSFRILHARPGGGFRGAEATPARLPRSPAPKSLTELFVVRNRQTGAPVQLPHAPDTAERKVYLHLGSMHPAAEATTAKLLGGGTVATTAHPNAPYLRHLYPMVQDSLGGDFTASDAALNKASLGTDNFDVRTTDFVNKTLPDALTGDAYSADPFDSMFERMEFEEPFQTALTDRLQQNSGIEIDLLSELRFVRENPTPHGLDREATLTNGTLSWLDMMPEAADLVAPGDHEILFVLYTGAYGQKMVDEEIVDFLNPTYCGCHLIASIEVNRPSQKVPSEGGPGLHYGASFETHHVLGHL